MTDNHETPIQPTEADYEMDEDVETDIDFDAEEELAADDNERNESETGERPTVTDEHLKSILESLLFVADKPTTARHLARAAQAKTADVRRLLPQLIEDYAGRGIEIVEVAGGYAFRTAPANSPFVRSLVQQRPVRLSRAQLETLAIVAYRQPVTRPEIDEIRGVDSGSALRVLAERSHIKILGRKDEPGRPLLYGTTPEFLEFFGLAGLKDLPTLKEFSELSDESRALFESKVGEAVDLHIIDDEISLDGGVEHDVADSEDDADDQFCEETG